MAVVKISNFTLFKVQNSFYVFFHSMLDVGCSMFNVHLSTKLVSYEGSGVRKRPGLRAEPLNTKT